MRNRYEHQQEVITFLRHHLTGIVWELRLPSSGRGHETYIAECDGVSYFIKLGAQVLNYQIMASLDLTPPVVEIGCLDDGTSILVQRYIPGRIPSWGDFRDHLDGMAELVGKTHHSQVLKSIFTQPPSDDYHHAGVAAVKRVQERWGRYRSLVPKAAGYIDEAIAHLARDAQNFVGSGLAVSHNDICNGNWLIAPDGKIYLFDLEAMSLDDPAHDLGALLWWYYPPELRQKFVERAGYVYDNALKNRMRVRMALHCLDIILPRVQSFDRFEADSFTEDLRDFKAVVEGRENPRGYSD